MPADCVDQGSDSVNARASVHDDGVDVVIVNWNSGAWLQQCLESLAEHGKPFIHQVMVVDNGSVDGSDKAACAGIPLQIVQTGANLGFGRACNIGARLGKSPYLLFLNPDAALLPSTFTTILAFMGRAGSENIGVCGVKLLESDGAVQRHCAHRPTASMFISMALGLNTLFPGRAPEMHDRSRDYGKSGDVDHVIGAFYLVRRTAFERVGGFDERFFVYLEDLDLSTRLREAGYTIHYSAEASAFHHGGGTSDQVRPQRLAYSLESRLVYSFKHFPVWQALLVSAATLIVEPVPRVVRGLIRGSWTEVENTVRGFGLLWQRLLARLFADGATADARGASGDAAVARPGRSS